MLCWEMAQYLINDEDEKVRCQGVSLHDSSGGGYRRVVHGVVEADSKELLSM
jgi:hypothetical protein